MEEKLSEQFAKLRERLKGYEYLILIIEYFAAPVIQGRKPSAIVSFSKDKHDLYRLWDTYSKMACKKLDIRCFELYRNESNISVLLFKPMLLEAYINAACNSDFLDKYGYDRDDSLMENLDHLKIRFMGGCPHEIGVFLGIPLDDVKGFIENAGEAYLMCGYWKVYNNVRRAEAYFKIYDRARIKAISSLIRQYKIDKS